MNLFRNLGTHRNSFGQKLNRMIIAGLLFFSMICLGCGGSGGGGDSSTNQTGSSNAIVDEGYWDVFIRSVQTSKIDAVYFQQNGDNVSGIFLLGDSASGDVIGNDISLSFPNFPECLGYSGVISGLSITGICTQGSQAGTQLDFEKSSFHISNFAPNDYLSVATPPLFAWTVHSNADSYLIRILLDNADSTCHETTPISCQLVWQRDQINANEIVFDEDSSALAPLQINEVYRVTIIALDSFRTEIDRTMDVRFRVRN